MSRAANIRVITLALTVYWTLFWLLNGLDKFVCRTTWTVFTWHGNDRVEKFSMYFGKLKLSAEWVNSTLIFAGLWELAVTAPLLLALYFLVRPNKETETRGYEWLNIGLAFSILTFIGFSVFDVVVGDRAELWEHGTYVVLVTATFLASMAERFWAMQASRLSSTQPLTPHFAKAA